MKRPAAGGSGGKVGERGPSRWAAGRKVVVVSFAAILLAGVLPLALGTGAAAPTGPTVPLRPASMGPSVVLSEPNGTVGSVVTASGSGFPANSSILFSLGGVAAPSSCRSDPTGAFPGTTGTPCSWVVPQVPGGNESITVSTGWQPIASLVAGATPGFVVYDPAVDDLFVSNFNGTNLTVVNATSFTTVGSVPLAASPLNLAVDPVHHHVLAPLPTVSPGTVAVVNDTTDSVVGNASVGDRPISALFDPANGRVYISNSNSDNLTVLDAANLSFVGSIPVGSRPLGMAYVPSLREVLVVNGFGNSMTVISATNDSVLTTIPIGANPYEVVVDPAADVALTADHGGGDVSFVDLANDSLLRTVPVGVSPDGIVDDPGAGESLVACNGDNTVVVLDDATGAILQRVPVGSGPAMPAFDPATGEVIVPNQFSDNLTVLAPSPGTSVPFTVLASVSAPSRVEVGATFPVAGDGFAADANLTTFRVGGLGLACQATTVGNCLGGTVRTDQTGAFNATALLPNLPTAGPSAVEVADAAGNSAKTLLQVVLDPTATTPIADPSFAAVGQTVTFSTLAGNGSGTYAFVWNGLPQGCTSLDQSTLACTPRTAGVYSISVTVTDGAGFSGTSPALAFTVATEYPLVFHETGLPAGTSWGVLLGSASATSAGPNVTFRVPNGTFTYVVIPVAGYVSVGSGLIQVNGTPPPVNVSFQVATFPVVFIVTGLPAGSNWSVTVTNSSTGFNETRSSFTDSIVIFLPNGTYVVSVLLPGGYGSNVSSTLITVAGRSVGHGFEAAGSGPSSKSSGVGSLLPYYTLAAAGVAMFGAGVVLAIRRRPPPEEPPDPSGAASAVPGPDPGGTDEGAAATDPLDEVF